MPDDLLTEAVLEATRDLDRRSTREILEVIHAEDLVAARAVGLVLGEIERAVEVLVLVLQGGGRWFNVGAGTSGRMGVLDAAEIPPTFGYPADRVQAIQAGGLDAVWRAKEGVEDRADDRARGAAAARAPARRRGGGDLRERSHARSRWRRSKRRRAWVRAASRSPAIRTRRSWSAAEVAIAPAVGPEVIAGSTRMKGGLAQKMVLHLLSTTVMVRLGRVEGNQMTNLVPASRKLERPRAAHPDDARRDRRSAGARAAARVPRQRAGRARAAAQASASGAERRTRRMRSAGPGAATPEPSSGGGLRAVLLELAQLAIELIDLPLEARDLGRARDAEHPEQALQLTLDARLGVLAQRLGALHGALFRSSLPSLRARRSSSLRCSSARFTSGLLRSSALDPLHLALGALLELLAALVGALLQALPVAIHVFEGAFETLAALFEQTLIPCHPGFSLSGGTARKLTRCVSASSPLGRIRICQLNQIVEDDALRRLRASPTRCGTATSAPPRWPS